jgi:lysophospholipase L1-like esterase
MFMFYRMFKYPKFVIPLFIALLLAGSLSSNAFAATSRGQLVGPKKFYLALGDSLAFGYQPNGDYTHGYVADFLAYLRHRGVAMGLDLGCPGETSQTFITGICSSLQTLLQTNPVLKRLPAQMVPKQMAVALAVLRLFAGQVSPVTLDIGANDMLNSVDPVHCRVDPGMFQHDLQLLDTNLQQLLPALHAALQVKGKTAGDLLVMNYYEPYQNRCPNLVIYTQQVNALVARDVAPYATLVDVFSAFGGAETPNPNLCHYTWICAEKPDIHSTSSGYQVIAQAFERTYGY